MSSTRPKRPPEPEINKNPAFIPIGAEVSARWDGAFCEANVTKMRLNLMLTVMFDDGTRGSHEISPKEDTKGQTFEPGTRIRAKHPRSRRNQSAKILHVQDVSHYVVVFNDGDMLMLTRQKLNLVGRKHFKEFTLNNYPIVDLKTFVRPVKVGEQEGGRRRGRKRKIAETVTKSPEKESQHQASEPVAGPSRANTEPQRKKLLVGNLSAAEGSGNSSVTAVEGPALLRNEAGVALARAPIARRTWERIPLCRLPLKKKLLARYMKENANADDFHPDV